MRPRDPHEAGRTATLLELFFDLVFVVAVSIAAVELHHALTEAHVVEGLAAFAIVFFAIWWAWMNVTRFGAVAVLLDPVIPVPTTLTAFILAGVVAVLVVRPGPQVGHERSEVEASA